MHPFWTRLSTALSLQYGSISARLRRSKTGKITRLVRGWIGKNESRRLRPRIIAYVFRPMWTRSLPRAAPQELHQRCRVEVEHARVDDLSFAHAINAHCGKVDTFAGLDVI